MIVVACIDDRSEGISFPVDVHFQVLEVDFTVSLSFLVIGVLLVFLLDF